MVKTHSFLAKLADPHAVIINTAITLNMTLCKRSTPPSSPSAYVGTAVKRRSCALKDKTVTKVYTNMTH